MTKPMDINNPEGAQDIHSREFLLDCIRKAQIEEDIVEDVADACELSKYSAQTLAESVTVETAQEKLILTRQEANDLINMCKLMCKQTENGYSASFVLGMPNGSKAHSTPVNQSTKPIQQEQIQSISSESPSIQQDQFDDVQKAQQAKIYTLTSSGQSSVSSPSQMANGDSYVSLQPQKLQNNIVTDVSSNASDVYLKAMRNTPDKDAKFDSAQSFAYQSNIAPPSQVVEPVSGFKTYDVSSMADRYRPSGAASVSPGLVSMSRTPNTSTAAQPTSALSNASSKPAIPRPPGPKSVHTRKSLYDHPHGPLKNQPSMERSRSSSQARSSSRSINPYNIYGKANELGPVTGGPGAAVGMPNTYDDEEAAGTELLNVPSFMQPTTSFINRIKQSMLVDDDSSENDSVHESVKGVGSAVFSHHQAVKASGQATPESSVHLFRQRSGKGHKTVPQPFSFATQNRADRRRSSISTFDTKVDDSTHSPTTSGLNPKRRPGTAPQRSRTVSRPPHASTLGRASQLGNHVDHQRRHSSVPYARDRTASAAKPGIARDPAGYSRNSSCIGRVGTSTMGAGEGTNGAKAGSKYAKGNGNAWSSPSTVSSGTRSTEVSTPNLIPAYTNGESQAVGEAAESGALVGVGSYKAHGKYSGDGSEAAAHSSPSPARVSRVSKALGTRPAWAGSDGRASSTYMEQCLQQERPQSKRTTATSVGSFSGVSRVSGGGEYDKPWRQGMASSTGRRSTSRGGSESACSVSQSGRESASGVGESVVPGRRRSGERVGVFGGVVERASTPGSNAEQSIKARARAMGQNIKKQRQAQHKLLEHRPGWNSTLRQR